ncbi:MAG TPA: hypothetical protein VKT18_02395 [Acidimicrobiales bacterium]|nr:hypothetical protein [Acidimicrobiales bacterium]
MPEPLVATKVTLVPAPGVGPQVDDLELRIDRSGITQLGGTPYSAWQIPWVACRDVRTSHDDGVTVIALSFGALRYRWELPDDGVAGGGEAVVRTLQALVGAKPMVRTVRGGRRRR